jgi:hypothetical protein
MQSFIRLVSTPKIIFAGAVVGAGIIETCTAEPTVWSLIGGAITGVLVLCIAMRFHLSIKE